MGKLSKSQPDFYSKISKLRKVNSGGKSFIDVEKAKAAQVKSVEARKRNKEAKESHD